MMRIRNFLALVALLVGAAILLAPAGARADYEVVISETGFATQSFLGLTSGGAINTRGPITIGQYSITVTTSDSAPGINPFFGGALISQNTFNVTTARAPTADLVVQVFDTTFANSLGAPLFVKNSLSSTAISRGTVTTFGYVNTIGNATPGVTLTGPNIGGMAQSSAQLSPGAGPTFTLGNVATVHGLGANGTDNFTVTTLAAVPEPASGVMVLTALPLLGLGYWWRRRQVRPQAIA